jgi:hypothetical protein
MRVMSRTSPLVGQDWLDQIFRSKAAVTGSVVRRKISDVDREVGREALELTVRQRGFHLIECDQDFVIICSSSPLRIIC